MVGSLERSRCQAGRKAELGIVCLDGSHEVSYTRYLSNEDKNEMVFFDNLTNGASAIALIFFFFFR